MPTTANRGYTYSDNTDPPQGNAQIQQLAEDVDADVAALPITQAKVKVIDVAQSTTSATYAELGTPDRIADLVVPENGLIKVSYRALVRGYSVSADAAIFLNDDQLTFGFGGTAPVAQEATITDTDYQWLWTASDSHSVVSGLRVSSPASATSPPTTEPFLLPAFIAIEVPEAGTYDVSVRYKTSTQVDAKERRLYAEVWKYAAA